ncbi:hypothetical protein Tco_0300229 [Tanacetum coccineum]
MKVKESLNVTFHESPSPTKLSSLVDDDVGEEEAIKKNTKVVNNNNVEYESIEVDEIVNIKESKNHPLDQEIVKKFRLDEFQTNKTQCLNGDQDTKDEDADCGSLKYRGTKMPSEYQQDYEKTHAYALKIYNDPNMTDALRDIYRTLESRYVHEGRTIDTSFYNDLSDDLVAKFTTIRFDSLLALDEQIVPGNLKENMAKHPFDERYKLVPRKMSSLKAKQPKKPPPKRTRNVGKAKHTQLSISSSTESPPSNNGELPSTKLSPRSYGRALKDDPNMSKKQRETRGMFKNLGRALHNLSRTLKKGCC